MDWLKTHVIVIYQDYHINSFLWGSKKEKVKSVFNLILK